MQLIDAMLKEYDVLHREQLSSLNRRHQLVAFGLLILGLVGSGALALAGLGETMAWLRLTLLCYGVPLLATFTLLLWYSEVERDRQRGTYLATLEMDINDTLGKDALVWTNYVHHQKEPRYPYLVVILFFVGIAVVAPPMGRQVAGLMAWTITLNTMIPWLLGLGVGGYVLLRFLRPLEQAAIPRERLPWDDNLTLSLSISEQTPAPQVEPT